MHELLHRAISLVRPAGIACSLVFSVGLVLFSTKTPSPATWKAGTIWLIALVIAGIVTAIYQFLVNVDQHRWTRQATLDDACRGMAAHLDEACPDLALRFIGVHIWKVRGFWHWRHLTRAGQFLISARASSNVKWTLGKGVVGNAWQERAPIIVDLEQMYATVGSKEEWNALPADQRLNLGWDEMQRTSVYKAIYATPLFNASNKMVIGVLAIDVLEPGHFSQFDAATNKRSFRGILGLCQDALREA